MSETKTRGLIFTLVGWNFALYWIRQQDYVFLFLAVLVSAAVLLFFEYIEYLVKG